MNKIISTIGILSALVTFGVGCTAITSKLTSIPRDFSLQYGAAGCYGNCPIYSIKLKADGTGTYEGLKHVEVQGTRPITMSQQELKMIKQKLDQIKFFSLEDIYICDQTGDAPRWSIQVAEKNKTKTITYNCGTSELHELGRLIEDMIDTRGLISASVDPVVCVERYTSLKRDHDQYRERLDDADQVIQSLRKKDEESQRAEQLWRRIATSSNEDRRWIGVTLMSATSVKFNYADQWDQTLVLEKKKSPSGKQTLVVFGQTYETPSRPIQRGFYVLNEKGEFIGSYVVQDAWEHVDIDTIVWKNEQTISYNHNLPKDGFNSAAPEKREYSLKK